MAKLDVNGGLSTKLYQAASAYVISVDDSIITADATSEAFTVTLPSAVGIAGREYTVKKIDNSSNIVTIGTTSSQTIDGRTSLALMGQWDCGVVVSDGSNWIIKSIKSTNITTDLCAPYMSPDSSQTKSGWIMCYITSKSSYTSGRCMSLLPNWAIGKNYGCWHGRGTEPSNATNNIYSQACRANIQHTTTLDAWSGTDVVLGVCIQL